MTDDRTDLGLEMEQALGEVLAHVRGERSLSCRVIDDPSGARILAIADSYDSMTHPHTQRPPMPPALALDEIERCSGTQFDPMVAEALGEVFADVAHVTH